MKYSCRFLAIASALFFTCPVWSMTISSEAIKTQHEYSGNVKIKIEPEEKFNIESNEITESNGKTTFSGDVKVFFSGALIKADVVSTTKNADGQIILEADKLYLEETEEKNKSNT